jgi:hypothetical protein
MFTPTVNYLGSAHPQRETEFYVLPPSRASENPIGLVELLRSLASGEPPAASGLSVTEASTQAWSWN